MSYGLVGRVGDERVERAVLVGDVVATSLANTGGSSRLLLGRYDSSCWVSSSASVLVGGHEVRDPALGLVGPGAAQLLELDVLTGDGLDDVGSGDEHVRGLVDHDDEVGDRRRVDRAARARAHDQRDLRDHPGGLHVAVEDLAVLGEGDDALLDAGAAGVVDPDDRGAGLERHVHDLDDLLAEHLAQRAAEDGEVLGEDEHLSTVDGAVAGDDAVAVRTAGPAARRRGCGAGRARRTRRRNRGRGRPRPAPGRSSCRACAAPRPRGRSRRGRPRRPCGAAGRACPRWCAGRFPRGAGRGVRSAAMRILRSASARVA